MLKNKLIFLRRWKYRNQKCRLNYLDLLMPFNGVISAHQYIVISRILDIERFLEGKTFFWQKHLTLLDGLEKLNCRDLERLDNQFYALLHSLNEKGYNTSIDNIIISKSPVELLNGTHRLAWISLFEKDLEIPCVFVNDYSIFPVNGEEWLKTINLPMKEIDIIKNRYNKLLSENDYCLLVIADSNICEILINEISKYFIVHGVMEYTFNSTDKRRKINKLISDNIFRKITGDKLVLFNLKLSSQLLTVVDGRVRSAIILSLERRLNIIDGLKSRFWIAHTIAESMRVRNIILE